MSKVLSLVLKDTGGRLLVQRNLIESKIRKWESCSAPVDVCMSRSGYTPWIQKRGGLESSGQRLISSFGKTQKIAFFFSFLQKISSSNFLL